MKRYVLLWASIFAIAAADAAQAGVYGSVQSPARPFGLNIVDRVQLRNSDGRARDFRRQQSWINRVLRGGMNTPGTGATTTTLLDPGRISLIQDYQARAYFFQDDAGYHNSLGINPNSTGVSNGAELIFPDSSSGRRRTTSEPLLRGDFVDLGLLAAGSILDFFLIADGANGGTDVFGLDPASNPDGLRHVAIHARSDADSPYLLLGFEDTFGGGDGDMNDLVVALDIGVENVRNLLNTVVAPEPGTLATLGSFVLAAGIARRRQRRKKAPAS